MSKAIVTQKKIILAALKDGQDLTAYEALKLCGTLRLSAHIFALREQGYNIKTNMVIRNGKRIAEYHLINEEGETK